MFALAELVLECDLEQKRITARRKAMAYLAIPTPILLQRTST